VNDDEKITLRLHPKEIRMLISAAGFTHRAIYAPKNMESKLMDLANRLSREDSDVYTD
jgi:hypothetical protein